MQNKKLIKGYILVILSAFIYGCMPMLTRYIYAEGVNRESVVLLRNLLSLPLLAYLTWRQCGSFKVPVKSLPAIIVIGLMGCCITPLLLYGSYQYIATGTATVFHFVYPAVVVLIGLVFLRKKVNKATLLAVGICVAGICCFYDPNQPLDWRGCAFALASGVTYAVYIVVLSAFRYKEVTGFKLQFYASVICAVCMLVVCVAGNLLTLPTTVTGWVLCMVLAFIIGFGAVALFQRGTFLIGGERASVLSTVEPLTGVIVGAIVFHERITPLGIVGVVLVLLACVLIALVDTKSKEKTV